MNHTIFLDGRKKWFCVVCRIGLSYFDRLASFQTRDHSLDKHVWYLYQLIRNHRYKRRQWYWDNRIVRHWENHSSTHPVNHNRLLKDFFFQIEWERIASKSSYECISMLQMSIVPKTYIPMLLYPFYNRSNQLNDRFSFTISISPDITRQTTIFHGITCMKRANRTGNIIHCIADIRWSVTKDYKEVKN